MRITFHSTKQKVEVHDDMPYLIGESTADWTMQEVLDYLWGPKEWHASWTSDVSIEDMMYTKVRNIDILGDFVCLQKID